MYEPCLARPAWKETLGTQAKTQLNVPVLCGVQPEHKASVAACGLHGLPGVHEGIPAQARAQRGEQSECHSSFVVKTNQCSTVYMCGLTVNGDSLKGTIQYSKQIY